MITDTSLGTGPLDGKKDVPTKKSERLEARLAQYRREIEVSARWRRSYEQVWGECLDLFRHKHKYSEVSADAPDCDRIQVNKAFTAIEIMMAATALEDPYITINEIDPRWRPNARMVEEVANNHWKRERFKLPMHDIWKDTLIFGHGWGKTGWRLDKQRFGEDRLALEEEVRAVTEAIRTSANVGAPVDIDLGDDLLSERARKRLGERGYRITRDAPVLHRVDPWDMYVPPDATRPWNMRWVAQRTRMTLECAREEHPHWNKKALDELAEANSGDSDGVTGRYGRYQQEESAVQWVDIYEFWDIKRNTVAVFGGDGEYFLSEPQQIPFKHGHPFVMCRNHEVPSEFYPIGDLECAKDQQYEINRIRSEQISTIRKQRTQYLAPESVARDPTFRQAILNNEANCVVPMPDKLFEDTRGEPLRAMPRSNIPADLYQMERVVCDDFFEATGISDFVNGGASSASTATEAAVANAGQQTRDGWKLTSLERFIEEVARNMVMDAQCFMATNQWVRLSGRQANLTEHGGEYAKYDRASIAGEFDYTVDVGSTVRNSPQLRQEQALQFITAIAPFAEAVSLNFSRVFEYVADAFGIKDADTFISGGPGIPGGIPQPNTAVGGPAPVGAGAPPGADFPIPQQALSQLEGQVGLQV